MSVKLFGGGGKLTTFLLTFENNCQVILISTNLKNSYILLLSIEKFCSTYLNRIPIIIVFILLRNNNLKSRYLYTYSVGILEVTKW